MLPPSTTCRAPRALRALRWAPLLTWAVAVWTHGCVPIGSVCSGPFARVKLYSAYEDATVTAAGACGNARLLYKGLEGPVVWIADLIGDGGDLCEVTATVAGEPPLTKSATIGWSEDCGAFIAVNFQFP